MNDKLGRWLRSLIRRCSRIVLEHCVSVSVSVGVFVFASVCLCVNVTPVLKSEEEDGGVRKGKERLSAQR